MMRCHFQTTRYHLCLAYIQLVTEASEASAADRRYIVIELGSNDGKWIKEYLERHALDGIHFWPVIVEAQPVHA